MKQATQDSMIKIISPNLKRAIDKSQKYQNNPNCINPIEFYRKTKYFESEIEASRQNIQQIQKKMPNLKNNLSNSSIAKPSSMATSKYKSNCMYQLVEVQESNESAQSEKTKADFSNSDFKINLNEKNIKQNIKNTNQFPNKHLAQLQGSLTHKFSPYTEELLRIEQEQLYCVLCQHSYFLNEQTKHLEKHKNSNLKLQSKELILESSKSSQSRKSSQFSQFSQSKNSSQSRIEKTYKEFKEEEINLVNSEPHKKNRYSLKFNENFQNFKKNLKTSNQNAQKLDENSQPKLENQQQERLKELPQRLNENTQKINKNFEIHNQFSITIQSRNQKEDQFEKKNFQKQNENLNTENIIKQKIETGVQAELENYHLSSKNECFKKSKLFYSKNTEKQSDGSKSRKSPKSQQLIQNRNVMIKKQHHFNNQQYQLTDNQHLQDIFRQSSLIGQENKSATHLRKKQQKPQLKQTQDGVIQSNEIHDAQKSKKDQSIAELRQKKPQINSINQRKNQTQSYNIKLKSSQTLQRQKVTKSLNKYRSQSQKSKEKKDQNQLKKKQSKVKCQKIKKPLGDQDSVKGHFTITEGNQCKAKI